MSDIPILTPKADIHMLWCCIKMRSAALEGTADHKPSRSTARDIGAVGGPGGQRRIGYREWVRRKGGLGDFHNYFNLKTAPISASVLEYFVTCYHAEDQSKPGEAEWFRAFGYDELVAKDKANLDIFWLKDESLEGAENPQPPDVIAAEIAENPEAALEQFTEIHEDLSLPTPSQLGPGGPLQASH